MSKSNLFQNDGKESITQNKGSGAPNSGDQKQGDDYHTFRNLSREFQDDNITPVKKNEENPEFAPKNGEKILAIYDAPDGSDKKLARNPNDRDDLYDNVKNFKIMHNTSQNSSNLASSLFPNQKTDSPLVDPGVQLKSSHPELNSILKESTKQIDKINKMLEEHKKKKALRHLNESIDRIDTSGNSITEDYIREMKAKLTNNITKPPPLENIEDYSAKKPAPNPQAATVMNGSVFPTGNKNFSFSQTNTPKSKRLPGSDIKNPIQDQSPKISKPSARIVTDLEPETFGTKGSESARNVRGTSYSVSNKQKSIDQNGLSSPKIPVEDRLIMSKLQKENRLKQLSQERTQEEMKEIKNIPTISKKSKEIVQKSERLQKQREELESYIRKDKTQIMIIEEQEELLKTELSSMKIEPKADDSKIPEKEDEVVITEQIRSSGGNEVMIQDTAEEEHKKKSSVQAGSIYSRMRKKEERTYSEIFLQKRSRSPTQENSKFTTPHNQSTEEKLGVHSPKTAELLKKVSTPKQILLKFELPQSEPKLKKSSNSTPSLKQDNVPSKSLSKQIEQLIGNKNSVKPEPVPEPLEKPDGFDMVQKLQIMSKNLKQIKNQRLVIRANSKKKKEEEEAQVQESPEKTTRTLGKERLSNQSLMESVKLRKGKFFEIIDNSLTIKEREEVLRDLGDNQLTQADGYEIDGALKKWDDIPIYERQALWLNAKKNKVQTIGSKQLKKELQECTFQPVLISKFASPKNFTPGGTPNKSLINGGESRFTSDHRSKSRSYSRERKNTQGSYHKWHELRKTWENELNSNEMVANGTHRK